MKPRLILLLIHPEASSDQSADKLSVDVEFARGGGNGFNILDNEVRCADLKVRFSFTG